MVLQRSSSSVELFLMKFPLEKGSSHSLPGMQLFTANCKRKMKKSMFSFEYLELISSCLQLLRLFYSKQIGITINFRIIVS